MTVLLTGGAGYIGSHVAVELLQSGYDVIIADTFYNGSPKGSIIISEITEKSARTYYVDIQNSADLEQIKRVLLAQYRKPVWMDEVYDRANHYRLCRGSSGFSAVIFRYFNQ